MFKCPLIPYLSHQATGQTDNKLMNRTGEEKWNLQRYFDVPLFF
jgi:hypothetical protein